MRNQISGSMVFDGSSLAASLLAELTPLLRETRDAVATLAGAAGFLDDTEALRALTRCGLTPEDSQALLDRLSALGVRLSAPPRPEDADDPRAPGAFPGWES